MSEPLTPEQIAALLDPPVDAPPKAQPRWIRPLGNAAADLIEQATNPTNRFQFGIPDIDRMMRGIGRGEMCMVIGKSHSAKTQVLLNGVANNPEKRILWVTPDEVAELVLMKLVAIKHHIQPEQLEQRLKDKDQTAIDLVNNTVSDTFPNLVVVDKTPDVDQMYVALDEAEEWWAAPCDLVVYDFLELIPGKGESAGVQANATALKEFAKEREVPLAVVHQSGRGGSDRGKPGGMDAMRYGGEAQSIYVVEVFRKRDNETASTDERAQHANTVTVNLAKNKRPPCSTGMVDLFIHPDHGYIRAIRSLDFGTPREHDKVMSYGGLAPDSIRTMEPAQADDYRQSRGYDRIHGDSF